MDIATFVLILFGSSVTLVGVIWLSVIAFGPTYSVYKQRLRGQADLAQAQAESRIRVLNAHANLDAAKLDAQSEVERAKGIAAAIKEVEGSLGGPEGYLRWKYIHMLEVIPCNNQIIYLPTEAGLPILEAGKRDSDISGIAASKLTQNDLEKLKSLDAGLRQGRRR